MEPTFDELYHENGSSNGYDQLNQLSAFARGELNSGHDSIASASRTQSWSPDALGNFNSVTTDSVTQDRTHNGQNQLTELINGSTTTTLTYDANGNMLTDDNEYEFGYDAWNCLATNGGTIHIYDALGRRVRSVHHTADNQWSVRNLYYSANWQLLEEKGVIWSSANLQYVWSPVYIDGLVTRYRDADGDTTYEEQLYAVADANWNITALIDLETGLIVEHFAYDPFGRFTVYDATWTEISYSEYSWDYYHQGGRYDFRTKLFYFRNRDYSPTLMRWVSQDPIGFGAADSNLYRYEGDNCVNSRDPAGLCENPKIWPDYPAPKPIRPESTTKRTCGLDITVALKDGLAKVGARFQQLSDQDKWIACTYMVSLAGWDINQLVFDNKNTYFTKGDCGTGACRGTVTVNGECHKAENVNYVLWGKMCRLCNDWMKGKTKKLLDGSYYIYLPDKNGVVHQIPLRFSYSLEAALAMVAGYRTAAWGGEGIQGRQAWTEAGWHGDMSKASKAKVTGCSPCSTTYMGNLTFRAGVIAPTYIGIFVWGQSPEPTPPIDVIGGVRR